VKTGGGDFISNAPKALNVTVRSMFLSLRYLCFRMFSAHYNLMLCQLGG
jgi:hypothetical protein